MKVALVHDDLIQYGGAEKLVMAMHEIWPEAPLYVSVASKQWLQRAKDLHINLITSFMQKIPLSIKLNRYYSPFLIHSLAFQSFNFDDFDVVISSSSRYAHSIITKPSTLHITYMNSPGRMFWEANNYFEREDFALLKPIRFLSKPFLSIPLSLLRITDYIASKRPDFFIANSKTPQLRIRKYYKTNPEIIYPFVDYELFQKGASRKGDYFLVLTRLTSWKRVDLAIEACNELSLKLKIIGEGPDMSRLKSLAGSTIEFLGRAEKERVSVLLGCKALINTQKEDFGIVPLEAMACGKPVVAYRAGGTLETIIEGKTGVFFDYQDKETLKSVLSSFDPPTFDPKACREQAYKFRKEIFMGEIKRFVTERYSSFVDGS